MVDFEMSQHRGFRDFTALTHLCFSLALYMYILALLSTCCKLWFYRSNWQNSHRFLLEGERPLNHSELYEYKFSLRTITGQPLNIFL